MTERPIDCNGFAEMLLEIVAEFVLRRLQHAMLSDNLGHDPTCILIEMA